MHKKLILLLATVTALLLLLCFSAAAWTDDDPPEVVFTDVPADHWAYKYVMDIFERGITNGITATTFGPEDPLTRVQFVTFLGRLTEVDLSKYVDAPPPFRDINPAANMTWAYGYICWAAETGVTTGTGDGTIFDPQGKLTREQMAVMVKRFADYYDIELAGRDEGVYIADWSDISSWAEEGIVAMTPVYMNVKNRLFRPKDDATRGEMAQVLSLFPVHDDDTDTGDDDDDDDDDDKI